MASKYSYNQINTNTILIVDVEGDVFAVNPKHLRAFFSTNYSKVKEKLRSLRLKEQQNHYQKNDSLNSISANTENMITSIERRSAREKQQKKTLTRQHWKRVLEAFDHSCAYCGEQQFVLHQDHFIALAKGGSLTLQNVIPACPICNSSKGDKDFFEWYRTYKYYSADREQKLLSHLYSIEKSPYTVL
jgi:5-methylcytosine-specific restriction endonuclease McrA